MDINKLNRAKVLLEKSESTLKIIDTLKNLGTDLNINEDDIESFRKSLYSIKEDLYIKLIELKGEYDKEFDCL